MATLMGIFSALFSGHILAGKHSRLVEDNTSTDHSISSMLITLLDADTTDKRGMVLDIMIRQLISAQDQRE